MTEDTNATKERKYPVVEMFGPTIQGEGGFIGQQTYFIRFGGCDFRCKMCDSMHAVDPKQIKANAEYLNGMELLEKFFNTVHKYPSTHWITLSGGNPAIHDLGPLIVHLQAQGFEIHAETQGSTWHNSLEHLDAITISPKGPGMVDDQEMVMQKLLHFLSQMPKTQIPRRFLKFVVFDQRDLDFAANVLMQLIGEGFLRSPPTPTTLFTWNNIYLSLGDDAHCDGDERYSNHQEMVEAQLQRYKVLLEDIQQHPVLHRVKFLPRLHVLLWGNEKER